MTRAVRGKASLLAKVKQTKGKTPKKKQTGVPSREEILAFIAEHPGQAGKREIARAFGLSGAAKIALKKELKALMEDGVLVRHRKRLSKRGELPSVTVLVIHEVNSDGELVALPQQWDENELGEPPRVLVLESRRPNAPKPGLGDRILARITEPPDADGDFAHAARPMKLLEKKNPPVLGIFRTILVDGRKSGGRIVPVSKKQDEIIVDLAGAGDARDGDLVEVEITKAGRHGLKRGRVKESLGNLDNEKAVSMIAIHAHEIPHIFPSSVLAAAEAAEPANWDKRDDWRHLPFVTIDPADAKDHDDALYAEPDPEPGNEGGFLLYVAIADVSYYVRPGSLLDKEALLRGNSVYFPDRVVPMLPERISNDLCSLKEGVDRPALGLRIRLDRSGRKKQHSFHRVMIKSAAKLAYPEAQAAIDAKPGVAISETTSALLDPVLKPLWACYEAMKKARAAREPLDLDLPERKILLKPDGTVDRVIVPDRLDAHRLVEECMIQANVAAAETLEKHKTPLIYRVHDTPSLQKLEALREFLTSIDLNITKSGNLRPSHFNHILKRVRDTTHADLVNQVILRSQSQAEYNPDNIGHFGLNLKRYAHFTSPIRRYADLIVHRALVDALSLGPGGLPKDAEAGLKTVAEQISGTERRAMSAERDTIDRLISAFMADRIGADFTGRIAGVTSAGLFVKLSDTGADGFVPISTLGDDYFVYDQISQALVGERTGISHRLGDLVEVRLIEAAPLAGALRFELLSEGVKRPGVEAKRSIRGTRRRRGAPPYAGKGRRRGARTKP